MGAKRHDEADETYFLEHLCTRADSVYRVAFALTLNLDEARACVEKAFEAVAGNLAEAKRSHAPLVPLVRACWQAFQAKKSTAKPGQSSLINALKGLSLESRACLVAVDGVGLAAAEAAAAFGLDERKVRELLAEARKRLMATDLKL